MLVAKMARDAIPTASPTCQGGAGGHGAQLRARCDGI